MNKDEIAKTMESMLLDIRGWEEEDEREDWWRYQRNHERAFNALTTLSAENEALRHDLERQMTIANEHVDVNAPNVWDDEKLDGATNRVRACVNACAGIPIEFLESGGVAKLVEALRLADAALSGANMNMDIVQRKVNAALSAAEEVEMSKIGNHRVSIQETEDYRFGWNSAERGEPMPPAPAVQCMDAREKHSRQCAGWTEYHDQERSL